MPSFPRVVRTNQPAFTLLVKGRQISRAYQIKQTEIRKEINEIPSAQIVLVDSRAGRGIFEMSESDTFVPGNKIEIRVGGRNGQTIIFKGVIVKHSINVDPDGQSALVVTCEDAAVKLTVGRKSAHFIEQKDSDVIRMLIGNAGLSASVEATALRHQGIVQYHSTDWDFIVTRAEVNGQIVVVDDGKVTVQAPKVDSRAQLVVSRGREIVSIGAEIDGTTQLPAVKSTAWDPSSQKVARGNSKEPKMNKQGNLKGKKLAEALGFPSDELLTSASVPEAGLRTWADAKLLKSRLARITGTVTIKGNVKPKPGKTMQLAGLGTRFDGNAFVSGVYHNLENGQWTTTVTFGLSPGFYTEKTARIEAPPAAGLLPAVAGLHIGIVTNIHDPDGLTRVQVKIPTLSTGSVTMWARLANFYATRNAGSFFIPEVDDEVVLGFLNGDPRHPVILGSLYSHVRTPPHQPDAKNSTKAIVSRSKMQLTFDDVKRDLQIETPDGHVITLSDDKKSITIEDSNKNRIAMAPGGITLESASHLTIKSKRSLNLESKGPLSVKSGTDVWVEGMRVRAKARTAFSAEGNASAELKSSGNLTIRGAMVKIN